MGLDGFIPGSRASFVLDFLVLAMGLVIPVLFYSLYLVRRHLDFRSHRRLQLGIAAALIITVVWFEIEVRIVGWADRARPSPYFTTVLFPFLYLHVAIAIATAAVWARQLWLARTQFDSNFTAHPESRRAHVRRGWAAAILMVLTTVTGWAFHYLAFIAN